MAEIEKDHDQRQVSSRLVSVWVKLGIGLAILAWLFVVVWVVPVS